MYFPQDFKLSGNSDCPYLDKAGYIPVPVCGEYFAGMKESQHKRGLPDTLAHSTQPVSLQKDGSFRLEPEQIYGCHFDNLRLSFGFSWNDSLWPRPSTALALGYLLFCRFLHLFHHKVMYIVRVTEHLATMGQHPLFASNQKRFVPKCFHSRTQSFNMSLCSVDFGREQEARLI